MKNPKLSIVTTTYNHEKYIRAAFDSFLMQKTNFDIEIVVGDDASTDNTPAIISEYSKNHPDIFRPIIRKKNIGATANSIEVLKAARGKYIALCEGDDYWTDTLKLQKQVDFLEAHSRYALCFHPVKVVFENQPDRSFVWPMRIDTSKLDVSDELKDNFIPTNSVVFVRQKYDKLPRDVLPLDWYLHLYNAQYGKIGFIDQVMAVYRRHPNGLWWDNDNDKALLWKKHWSSILTMHAELLKLYGKEEAHKLIIYNSIKRVIANLASLDLEDKTKIVKQASLKFPDIAAQLIEDQALEINNQTEELKLKNTEIEELNAELVAARAQAYELKDKLHALTNARLLGRIIKLREFIGSARKLLSLRRAAHQVRVIGAPFMPGPLRRLIKAIYRKLRQKLSDEKPILVEYKTLDNSPWPKSKPLVSVVIPYYNRANTIDDTLDSLAGQFFTYFEIIIVDDGSPDPESIEKLEDIKKTHPEISIIHQANQGVAAARNNGIGRARGKYIICLDSDDMLEPTFIEKSTILLEADPDVDLVTTYKDIFGVVNEVYKNVEYNALDLYNNNMVITAAEFRKEAWQATDGYKSNIGYEDWEFWLTLAEHDYFGKLIPEAIFKYRTAMNSRYVEDKDLHWKNIKTLHKLHPNYKSIVSKLVKQKQHLKQLVTPQTVLINMKQADQYVTAGNAKEHILITIPWLTFGGAETLIYNFCRELKEQFNVSFVTGLKSGHEWEYKFKQITPYIYHLANLFEDPKLYLEFVSNYISTRDIKALHVIHNGFTFSMLEELKKRHPKLKVCVTMFNDRVEYFEQSIMHEDFVDTFTTDNQTVARHYSSRLKTKKEIVVIPNGINCYEEYNPAIYDRDKQRKELGIKDDELAVLFVGRMSEEKNPDVFVKVAEALVKQNDKLRFFMIGNGPMTVQINEMIDPLGNERIKNLDYQSEVARYLSGADIFILPSSIEGFPLSILEAMAMKLAVVASDVGAVGEIIETGVDGFVVEPGSVEQISEVITKIQSDPALLAKIKRNARDKVETKYSNLALGRSYRKLYEDLTK